MFRIGGTQSCDEMGLEGLDSPFSGVTPMNVGRNKLALDFIFEEAVLQGIRCFIVENVEIWRMALLDKLFVCRLPGIPNACSLAIRNCDRMNGVRIVMIKDKKVVIAATRGDGKLASLIRVRFDEILLVRKHDAELMTVCLKSGS